MSKPWILTTPASRGIGHALTRYLLLNTRAPIVATARHDTEDVHWSLLDGLRKYVANRSDFEAMKERLKVMDLDVEDESSVEECASFCSKHFPKDTHHLQLAYMIPGILHPEKSPAQIQAGKALRTLGVNVIGPMLLAKHFSPYLPRKATETLPSADDSMKGLPKTAVMAMMSARVGSITDNKLGGWYSYRASKAAVNQLVKSLDIYANQTSGGKSMVLGLHPGTVKTDFSEEFWASVGERGMLSPEQSANHLHRVVLEHGESGEGGGRCWDWKGIEVPP